MSNYVSNKVICSKDFYYKYFYDENPFGDTIPDEYVKTHPYVTFNKLFKVQSINAYNERYGTSIYYGFGHKKIEIDEKTVAVTFHTRWLYPICAIVRGIEIDHDVIWYAVEENHIYISRFSWKNNTVVEDTLNLENQNFYYWEENNEYDWGNKNLHDSDDSIWYYDFGNNPDWITWQTNDLIGRYKDVWPYEKYRSWYLNLKRHPEYKYEICRVSEEPQWLFVSDKDYSGWGEDVFDSFSDQKSNGPIELLLRIKEQTGWNLRMENDLKYFFEEDPLELVFQWDDLFGFTIGLKDMNLENKSREFLGQFFETKLINGVED